MVSCDACKIAILGGEKKIFNYTLCQNCYNKVKKMEKKVEKMIKREVVISND